MNLSNDSNREGKRTILCAIDNYCRPVPEKQFWNNNTLKENYQVNPYTAKNISYIRAHVQASPRFVRGVKIANAAYYMGSSKQEREFIETFKGSTATLFLGGKGTDFITIQPDGTLRMNCHTLEFIDKEGVYDASCFGQSWGSPVTFTVTGAEREQLDALKSSIDKVVDEKKSEYLWFQVTIYPLFFYLFLLLSLLCWLAVRAARFVKAG